MPCIVKGYDSHNGNQILNLTMVKLEMVICSTGSCRTELNVDSKEMDNVNCEETRVSL